MSVGSLTTTFTPPSSCLASFQTTGWSQSLSNAGFFFAGPLTTSGCMPDNFQFSSTNFYSPGICPVGYTTACHSLSEGGIITETVVTCCPTSYACNSDPQLNYPWQSTFGCQSTFGSAQFPSVVTFSGIIPVATGTQVPGAGAINALSVQIRYQSTDFQSQTSSPAPTSTTSTATTSSISSNGGAGGGISPGAAAGIGVGSAAVALFLAGAFVFVYTLGRRRRLAENTSASPVLNQKDTVLVNTNAAASGFPAMEMPTNPMGLPEMQGHPN